MNIIYTLYAFTVFFYNICRYCDCLISVSLPFQKLYHVTNRGVLLNEHHYYFLLPFYKPSGYVFFLAVVKEVIRSFSSSSLSATEWFCARSI
jgi:hypothetical protein